MDTMLTYNTNSKTGPVCGGRAGLPFSLKFEGLYIHQVSLILRETHYFLYLAESICFPFMCPWLDM